jgi:hypothetical protein
MATTTNYSWSTPDDTALVKDGAAAIRSLGTAIDSTVFTNAGAAIAKTIVDAKGDLIVASGSDAVARLAVGTNDHVLTADSAATNGVKWAALPSTTPTFVGASVSFDANKSIANTTTTTLTFDVELIDTDGFHDNSSNTSRLTIPSGKNGKYLITTQLFPIENSTGRREVRFIKNGSVLYGWNMNGYGTMEMINFAAFMNLVAGDYIEMSFRQSSGGSLTLYGSNTSTGVGDPGFFNIQYLGA